MPPQIENVRHSLSHLLAMAVLKKFPKAKLGIGPVIENGFYYDFDFVEADKRGSYTKIRSGSTRITPEDLPGIEKQMRELIKKDLKFKKETITFSEVKKLFSAGGGKEQPYKLELIKELNRNKEKITIYKTFARDSRNYFVDLCAGPHVKSTSEINPDAFKLTQVAGAYWKGSEKNPMLTRIYGVAFATKKELGDWLRQQEEAEKRDHRKLGEKLELFTFAPEVGPGLPLWMPKGTIIKEELEKFGKEVEAREGYQRVWTPHIARAKLYESSGHLAYFTEDMFPPMRAEDGDYYLKPMNCPHMHMIYKTRPRSWRELPLRLAEFGTIYRYERSGELFGLLRVRGTTQNDAHIYCAPEQAGEEFLKVLKLHEFYYNAFGIKEYWVELALPDFKRKPGKYIKDPMGWKGAIGIIKQAMQRSGIPYEEKLGEAAFYAPKADFNIKSVFGKAFGASTNQLDFASAKRFKLAYIDKDGKARTPYIIHRAPLGSDERFIGFLIEHYAGAFPTWLAPVQAALLPVSEKHKKYAQKVYDELKDAGVRIEIMAAQETLGKRIREAEIQKIPYVLIVGEKEEKNNTVSVRVRGKGDIGAQKLEEFVRRITNEIAKRAAAP